MDNNYILAVSFQFMKDEGKLASELVNSGKPFIGDIVPGLAKPSLTTTEGKAIFGRIHPEDNFYPEWAKAFFRDNSDNPNITWVQGGYRHCCGRCFDRRETNGIGSPDPHHEHVCLDGHTQSLEEQIFFIEEGKKILLEDLGITPLGYRAANHLYNQDTLTAARANGFKTFISRNGFNYIPFNRTVMPAYQDKRTGLIIIPETKRIGTSPIVMCYYNDNPSQVLSLLHGSSSMGDMSIEDIPESRIIQNERLIIRYKQFRDFAQGAVGTIKKIIH